MLSCVIGFGAGLSIVIAFMLGVLFGTKYVHRNDISIDTVDKETTEQIRQEQEALLTQLRYGPAMAYGLYDKMGGDTN